MRLFGGSSLSSMQAKHDEVEKGRAGTTSVAVDRSSFRWEPLALVANVVHKSNN